MHKILTAILFVSFAINNVAYAGNYQKLVILTTIDGNNIVFLKKERLLAQYDTKNDTYKTFTIYPKDNRCQIGLDVPTIDPSAKKIALPGGCSSANASNKASYYLLTVIDLKTKTPIAKLRNAETYSFSPSGNSIAYTEDYSGETGYAIPAGYQGGLWVYNFKTKAKKRIDTLGVNPEGDYRPQDLNWSEHDGNIYYTNYDKVFRYDPRTGKGTITSHKGIYFSPDGKYYAIAAWEGGGGICRTSDDREMIEWEKLILVNSPKQYQDMAFMFWSKKLNAGVFSVTVRDQKTKDNYFTNVIFDVGQGRVLGDFQGYIMGINAQGSLAAISAPGTNEQGKIKLINLTKFKK